MSQSRILLVDDEAINLDILSEFLNGEITYPLEIAKDGEAAWTLLQNREVNYKLILLDRIMPGLDGIGLLKRIKADQRLAGIPVIMQTAASSPKLIREGLEAGAYYYLTKPYRRDDLLAIVHAAMADAETRDNLRLALNEHIGSLHFLKHAEFSIRTIDEARQLASFLANACPEPGTAIIGISELLINGIEHGNLGLSYEEKSILRRGDNWRTEIDRRSMLPENLDKTLHVTFKRQKDEIELRIADQGAGFNWQNYLDINPERAFDPNGRGIALARMLSFNNIRYEGKGNIAIATIHCAARVEH